MRGASSSFTHFHLYIPSCTLQAIAQALLEGNCFSSSVATTITAETGIEFEVIEGCERGDFSYGDASGSTDGSTAEGVRSQSALADPVAMSQSLPQRPAGCAPAARATAAVLWSHSQ